MKEFEKCNLNIRDPLMQIYFSYEQVRLYMFCDCQIMFKCNSERLLLRYCFSMKTSKSMTLTSFYTNVFLVPRANHSGLH